MPEILELAHLVQQHGVAEMKIRCRGIEAGFDLERTPLPQFFAEFGLSQDLIGATCKLSQLCRDVSHVFPIWRFAGRPPRVKHSANIGLGSIYHERVTLLTAGPMVKLRSIFLKAVQ